MERATDPQAQIDRLNELAWLIRMEDPDRSRQLGAQAQELATTGTFAAAPYWLGVAGGLRTLAFLNNDVGNYPQALSDALRAFELLQGAAGAGPQARLFTVDVLGSISWTYRGFGDYGVAAEYGMRALKLAEEAGDLVRQARLLNILGNIYAETNDLPAAIQMGQAALQHNRAAGEVAGESVTLNNLALSYLESGDGPQALRVCQDSLRLAREHGVTAVVLTAMGTLGEIYLGLKDYAQAEAQLGETLALARQRQARSDEFLALLNLGKVYHGQLNYPAARVSFEAALTLAQTLQDRAGQTQCYQGLAQIYEQQGQFETALLHFKQFHALKETLFTSQSARRLEGLQMIHQLETAKRDAEIQYLKAVELKQEIEERKAAQAALQELAAIDPLTGLLNRREFLALGERELARRRPDGQRLTAILFDIDHFKRVNDTYGHAAGDQVLRRVAGVVRDCLRQGEILGRFGGDEFAIVLPNSSRAQAQQIAERLRETLAGQAVATAKGDVAMTASLGVAELTGEDQASLDRLLEQADQALYVAKRNGRDQVAVFTDGLSAP